jgi:hypothetical protein
MTPGEEEIINGVWEVLAFLDTHKGGVLGWRRY